MKTTGLTIQEAIKAVRDGQARGCKNEYGFQHIIYDLDKMMFTAHEVLDTWSLIDPVITPSPGEVWKYDALGKPVFWYVIKINHVLRKITAENLGDDYIIEKEMIHGQNGWTRVFDPKEGEK